jgi:hypothetical protein
VVGGAGAGHRQGYLDRSQDRRSLPASIALRCRQQAAFDRLHDWLRSLPGEHDVAREISALCARHGVDETAVCRELCMSWDELKPFAAEPLVTIGAHTITHCNLAADRNDGQNHEPGGSKRLQRPSSSRLSRRQDRNRPASSLARAARFKTAVTTRPGMIFPEAPII